MNGSIPSRPSVNDVLLSAISALLFVAWAISLPLQFALASRLGLLTACPTGQTCSQLYGGVGFVLLFWY